MSLLSEEFEKRFCEWCKELKYLDFIFPASERRGC